MYRTMICSSLLMRLHGRETRPKRIARHPSAHLPRASLDGLCADRILTWREFLPPLTNIASTLVVQRGTPSVLVEDLCEC